MGDMTGEKHTGPVRPWPGTHDPSSQALPKGGEGDKKEAERAFTGNQNVCLAQCALVSKTACALKPSEGLNFDVFPLRCSLLETQSICSCFSLWQLYFHSIAVCFLLFLNFSN